MKANLLTLAITLTLGVILAGSLLMPVLTDAQNEFNPTYSNVNDGALELDVVTSATISKDAGVADKVTINDEEVSLTTSANAIVFTDSFVINARTTNFYVITSSSATNVSASTAFTATISEGTITYKIGTGSETTVSYSGTVLVASTEGEYTNIASGTAYTDDLNKVYGWSWSGNKLYTTAGTETTISGTPGALTDLADTKNDAYDSLYTLNIANVKMDSGVTNVAPVTVILPTTFTAQMNGSGAAAATLIGALPILVILGLVVAATTLVIRNKD